MSEEEKPFVPDQGWDPARHRAGPPSQFAFAIPMTREEARMRIEMKEQFTWPPTPKTP